MAATNEGVIYARGLFEGIVEMLTDEWNAIKKFCTCGSALSKIKDNNDFLLTCANNSKVIVLKIRCESSS